ncbi:MAG: two-component system sensor histidine kinase NtrB [Chloroflexota bacterium]
MSSDTQKPGEIQAVLEQIPGAALLVDVCEERIACVNRQAAAYACCPAETLAGQALGALLPAFQEKPEQRSLRELAGLAPAHLWVPQERPLTSLHRAARAAQLAYVASAPIGEPRPADTMILAIGVQRSPAPEALLPVVQLAARCLADSFEAGRKIQQLEQRLESQQQQLARLQSIQENLRDGVLWVSAMQTIERMNGYAEQMLGYASSEVRGQRIENILIGEQNLLHALELARHHGYTHDAGAVTLYRRDGKPILVGTRIQSLQTQQAFDGWAVLLQDLSIEQHYRIRSRQLEQRALLGEVTAVFAHEVRNPINNISTGLQLMAMNLPADAPQQAPVARMQQDCDRLSELMKSVLAFARPQEYKFEPLAVASFLNRMLERWHPRLVRAGVETERHFEVEIPQILADARALEQVFTNLIQNAVQAMDASGGKLILSTRQSLAESGQRQIEITMADTGPGIPDEQREHIFEPFFTTKAGGTGLGLAITKQIVTAHRGAIRVISIPGGTAFQVLLPAHP